VAGTSSEDAVSKISYTDFCTFLASGLNSTTEMQTTTTLQIKDKDKHMDDGKGNGGEHDTDKDNSNVKSNTKKTGTLTVTEKDKLSQRKKYIRFLTTLNDYLRNFLGRISPLLDMEGGVIRPCLQEFEDEWSKYGGISGEGGDLGTGASWEFIPSDRFLAVVGSNKLGGNEPNRSNANENAAEPSSTSLDLKQFASVEELMERTTPDALKVELSRLGMKCGGRPLDRAKRLWLARDTPLEDLPKKIFTKGNPKKMKEEDSNGNAVDSNTVDSLGSNQRRIDIARMETIAHALLNQLRPALDATSRRSERRLTQTLNEKEREMEEEINGTYDDGNAAKQGRGDNENGDDQSDDSDDEDAPIYNPKGVPLGWDGKPIPYWLFKLHGLNHFYKCEICGNVSYRGRHNFEKHFAEAKHSYGMKCLGIPNTKHFHGVTKIEDAQNLWRKLQADMNKDIFDASKEEEYEDSNGNVLSRATYEDLARQGLL
jgi:splicing factor 3A subunit 3